MTAHHQPLGRRPALEPGDRRELRAEHARRLLCREREEAPRWLFGGDRGGDDAKGVQLDLALVPQREEGMTAYEIMLSESQERMLIVAHAGREREVVDIFRKWDLDAVVIGRVTDTGDVVVVHGGERVAEIPSRYLTDEAPRYERPMRPPTEGGTTPRAGREVNNVLTGALGADANGDGAASPSLTSYSISRRTDGKVAVIAANETTTVQPGDVVRVVRTRLAAPGASPDEAAVAPTTENPTEQASQ